jgi:hypothetical protein
LKRLLQVQVLDFPVVQEWEFGNCDPWSLKIFKLELVSKLLLSPSCVTDFFLGTTY